MYKILEKTSLNPTVSRMVIQAPRVAQKAQAGMFIILRADADGERIPLTIADYDRERGTVTIIYQIVGATTRRLDRLGVGECVCDFVGPLGRPTELDGLKTVAVVGGGVGCAIALPTAKRLHELGATVHSVIGFRNKDLVILQDEFAAALGPLVMMKFVCKLTEKYGIKTVVSMNPIMIDGTGMCGGCRLTVGGEMKFACVDGPDFDGHKVDFDEAIERGRMYAEFEKHAYEKDCNLFGKGDNA